MSESNVMILEGDMSDESKMIKQRDAYLASYSVAAVWNYDIKTRTMTVEFNHEIDEEPRIAIFPDFSNTIKAMHMIAPEDEALFEVFCAELDAGKKYISVEYRSNSKDYQIAWVKSMGHTILDENGQPKEVQGIRYDITREKNAKEEKSEQDVMTGLYNRAKSKALMEKKLASKIENSALVLIDVDDFHSINDTYGRMQGDAILQTIAGIIYTHFMSKDIVGRIAGDQFAVLCEDIEEEKLMELLNNLSDRLMENVPLRNGEKVTISMGVALGEKDGDCFDILYARADLALHSAKRAGGNRISRFSDDTMSEIHIGYTFLKKERFIEDEIHAEKSNNHINKKLFDFAFDTLSKEENVRIATRKVFEEVCLHYGFDRAILHELDQNREETDITVFWSRVLKDEDIEKIWRIPVERWDELCDNKNEDRFWIFNNGRTEGIDFFREIIGLNNPPVSSIQFPIFDENVMTGIVTFESFDKYEFNQNETATLKSVVSLITSYLLGQQVKHELETESVINKNVMDAQRIVYYVVDEDTLEIKYLSKFAKRAFPNARYGCKCYESLLGASERCATCPMLNAKDGYGMSESYNDVDDKWYSLISSHINDEGYENDALICITDVTDFIRKVRAEDPLTGMLTYDAFVNAATKLVRKNEGNYAIGCTGIYNFSKINDEYGYEIGDRILKRFAELFNKDIYEGELVARIKGDDFVTLYKQMDEEELRKLFNDYSRTLTAEFSEICPGIDIFCFLGSYNIPKGEEYINKCVDNSLKARKRAMDVNSKTRGYFLYSAEIEEQEKQNDELLKNMRQAIAEDRFKVYFQPKVDVFTGKIIGAEALVRMVDAEGKMVSPGLFIPLAEKTGFVVEIDRYVYEKTYEYISKWKKEGKTIPLISVNLSRIHLIDDNTPLRMKELAEKYELDPSELEIEITESVFFEDTERLINMIRRLKEIGFVISMDDFGSGYSTLNFMKTLPVDVIKIDGGFFMRNDMDNKSKAIISAIIQMTRNLEFDIVSEGVETQEQIDFIKEQGGTCVQGYYFYKPLSAEEFEKLI